MPDIELKKRVKEHFERLAPDYARSKGKHSNYYSCLLKTLKEIILPGESVLEIGCRTGALLRGLNSQQGVGIDISFNMVKQAKAQAVVSSGDISFVQADANSIPLNKKFDYIVLADIIEHLDDIFSTLNEIRNVCRYGTKIVITSINPYWAIPLHVAERLGLRMPEGPQNWISVYDLCNLLYINDFEVCEIRFEFYSMMQVVVARKTEDSTPRDMSVSVIIPAYNEAENISTCVLRVPTDISRSYEIIVVDDGSVDGTAEVVKNLEHDNVRLVRLAHNQGKGSAVRRGFESARGEILVILDADMAVPPEEIPRFVKLIQTSKADFVNGTRLVYPMESGAMNDLKLLGNKLFSLTFSWLLGRRVTDTLCGTKALRRSDFLRMIMKDQAWPDFDLLFGAAKNGLRIVEMPVHYRRRQAGKSKMRIFRHGLVLLREAIRGFFELKIGVVT